MLPPRAICLPLISMLPPRPMSLLVSSVPVLVPLVPVRLKIPPLAWIRPLALLVQVDAPVLESVSVLVSGAERAQRKDTRDDC